jgi:Flp pilus assembly protein TadB
MTGRGLRGRQQARLMLIAAVLPNVLVAFLYIARPNYMRPMFDGPLAIWTWLVPAIGIVIDVVGLGWMIRIYRTDPEAGRSAWRALRDR